MSGGYVQEKFESVPGTELNSPTLSTKVMYVPIEEFSYTTGTDMVERDDELRNSEEQLLAFPDHYSPTWRVMSRMYPDATGWALKHILGPPTTTAGDGVITDPDGGTVPATTYRHVWDSTSGNWGNPGIAPLTAQIIAAYADQGVFVKLKGCGADTLTIANPATGGSTVERSGPALYHDEAAANPSATPAYESLATRPFLKSGLSIPTFLASSGVQTDFGVTVSRSMERDSSLSGSKWDDILEKGDGPIVVTAAVPIRQIVPAALAALRAGTSFGLKAKWLNDSVIAATSYHHTLWLEGIAGQYTDQTPGALANTRRIGLDTTVRLATAGTGSSVKFTLINGVSSYV